MTDRESRRKFGFRAACRMLDLLVPGAGMLLSGRAGAGVTAIAVWSLVLIGAAGSVCFEQVHPVQALIVAAVLYATIETFLLLEPLGRTPRVFAAGLGVAIGGLCVFLGVAKGLGTFCEAVVVRDYCEFPGLLPGEAVLVRSGPGWERGDLVAVRTPRGPVIARVLALQQEHVVVAGHQVTVSGDVLPFVELGDVRLPEDVEAPPEETRSLRVYQERLDRREHPFFVREGVYAPERIAEVGPQQVFVLCDNRTTANAEDSRHLGPFSVNDVIGRLGPILWSRDPRRIVRTDRLGATWQ